MANVPKIVIIVLLISSGRACSQVPAARTSVVSTTERRLERIANMSVVRSGHTATLLPDGKVLITGGSGNGGFLASAELFDPNTRRFAVTGNMSSTRAGHTATLLQNGSVLIVGGLDERDHAEVYDPVKATFSAVGELLVKRVDHTATLLRDGRVLIVGGSSTGTAERPLATAEIYDPSSGRFTASGKMNVARTAHAAVLLKNGKVLITGGGSGRYPMTTVFKSAELYDPERKIFTRVGDMTTPRYKHAAIVLGDGKVLITGGSNERDWSGRHASAELYEPAKTTFTATGNMNTSRFKHRDGQVGISGGRIFIAGGGEYPEIYSAATGTFTAISEGFGEPRFFSTATLLKSGEVLMTGGYNHGTPERGPVSTPRAWVYRP